MYSIQDSAGRRASPAESRPSPAEKSKHLASPDTNSQTTNSHTSSTQTTSPQNSSPGRSRGARAVTAAEKAQAREVSLRRIGRLFAPYKWQMAIVTAIIVASSIVGVASPFLLRAVIDTALPDRNLRLLILLVAGMIGIAAVTSAFGVIQTWISTKVGQQVMHGLRTSVFGHLQRQSVAFFTRTRSGEVQSRITN